MVNNPPSTMDIPTTVDLRKYIEVRLMGNKPHIRKRRLPVAVIAYMSRDNQWDINETAAAFDLSETQVLAALLYYQENQALIDDQEAAEQSQADMWTRQADHD